MDINEEEINEIIRSDLASETNKYEEENKLLKKYQDECRMGANKKRLAEDERGVGVNDDDDDDYLKFKNNFMTKISSNRDEVVVGGRYSTTSAAVVNSSTASMKNDFRKNEDEIDEDSSLYQKPNHILNKKNSSSFLPPSVTTTSTTTTATTTAPSAPLTSTAGLIYSYNDAKSEQPSDESNFLLNSLVSRLSTKFKPTNVSAATSAASATPKSIQFNNYKNEIDEYSSFGLTYDYNKEAASSDMVILNFKDPVKKNATSSSNSSTSSTSSSSYIKPNGINRRSADAYMDSHGSSLTNSSKQDDEDYEDEEAANATGSQPGKNFNEENEFELDDASDNEFTTRKKAHKTNYSNQVNRIYAMSLLRLAVMFWISAT